MMILGLIPFFFLALVRFGVFRAFSGPESTAKFTRTIADFGRRASSIPSSDNIDGVVFRLARRSGGRVTLSEVVIETGMDIKSAEKYMDTLSDGTHVIVDVDGAGRLVYLFPENGYLLDSDLPSKESLP